MSDQAVPNAPQPAGRIEPEFWEDKRFFAVPEVLRQNPRRHNVAGWHSLQLIRQEGTAGLPYALWKMRMPTDIVNSSGTNHHHLRWDWEHHHIRVELDEVGSDTGDRTRDRGAPPPQKSRAASEMANVGSATYALKIFRDTDLVAFKLGRSENPKTRQELFNLHSMPGLGGLYYVIFLEYYWLDNEDAHRLESWLKSRFEANRRDENAEIIAGVSEEQLRKAWSEGIDHIEAASNTLP